MIKNYEFCIMFFILLFFIGCSYEYPNNSLKEEQYEVINQNVKKALGNEYSAINFTIIEEGFTNTDKTEFAVKFIFDLNKSYLLFNGKQIPGELKFSKTVSKEWSCTYNSVGNTLSILNQFQLLQ